MGNRTVNLGRARPGDGGVGGELRRSGVVCDREADILA
jgi:hypothetical protein